VRELAAALGVSPGTVASAYRTLRQRGVVNTNRRRGTIVAGQPPLRVPAARPLRATARDLASGNPDPALLPALEPALRALDPAPRLYGGPINLERLVRRARANFGRDGIRGDVAILGGALDCMERALQTQLRPGDRVVVEDPSWPRIADLVVALGFELHPVPLDERGLDPAALEHALVDGARAVIATPRGQNPTGAAFDPARAKALRTVLRDHPDVLVVEDDYVASVAGTPYHGLHRATEHWLVVRSLSKVLGPDLRIAPAAGDALTISRIEGRQLLGSGWVSHLLQQTAAHLWETATSTRLLARARRTYGERRRALVAALAEHGLSAAGDSGLGVWLPVHEEVAVVEALLDRGWAVSAGERFRFASPPGIRITTTTLEPQDAQRLAAEIASLAGRGATTYAA
jgi:DNA-binding transcriptional MocR family regulator